MQRVAASAEGNRTVVSETLGCRFQEGEQQTYAKLPSG